jgi:prefoldin subunit 5|tara:strand:+ start:150 stop:335 length:186 start_codon:yes stop_codon:yes gene_type:complete
MHEKIKKLSALVDKLIEQNFKLKTESRSMRNKIEELHRRIEILQTENQSLIIKSTENKKNE